MTEPTDPIDERYERAFRDALQARADELPPAALVVRRPRSWALALTAAAAVVVVTAGLAVVAVTAGGSDPDGTVAADPDQSTPPTTGWRRVSQGAVEVEVPDAWGNEIEPFDTCNYTPPTDPYVALDASNIPVSLVGCSYEPPATQPSAFDFRAVPADQWQPHLRFQPAGKPDGTATYAGWTVSTRTVGATQVLLLTDAATAPLADQILDSARVVAVDANGCDTTSPIQARRFVRPAPAFDVGDVGPVDSVSLCLYGRSGTDVPGLTGSRRLNGAAATSLAAAIAAAPVGGGPDAPQNCVHDMYGDTGTVVRLHQGSKSHDVYVYADWCFGNGFDDGTNRRELTRAACQPIFAEPPVQMFSGSSEPFARCVDHSSG